MNKIYFKLGISFILTLCLSLAFVPINFDGDHPQNKLCQRIRKIGQPLLNEFNSLKFETTDDKSKDELSVLLKRELNNITGDPEKVSSLSPISENLTSSLSDLGSASKDFNSLSDNFNSVSDDSGTLLGGSLTGYDDYGLPYVYDNYGTYAIDYDIIIFQNSTAYSNFLDPFNNHKPTNKRYNFIKCTYKETDNFLGKRNAQVNDDFIKFLFEKYLSVKMAS